MWNTRLWNILWVIIYSLRRTLTWICKLSCRTSWFDGFASPFVWNVGRSFSRDPRIRVVKIGLDLFFVRHNYCLAAFQGFRLRNLLGGIDAWTRLRATESRPGDFLIQESDSDSGVLIRKYRGMVNFRSHDLLYKGRLPVKMPDLSRNSELSRH
jgi:hypothetical protein